MQMIDNQHTHPDLFYPLLIHLVCALRPDSLVPKHESDIS